LDGKYSIKDDAPISEEVMKKLIVTKKDFEEAFRNVTPSAMREVLVETPNVPWDRIGGLNDIKERLKESVEWPLKNPKIFSRMGIRAPKGILLYGPPGTGKTLLAKAVATESEANFISVKGPELLNKYVGESEKGVRDIFRKAKQVAPSIIFFDEIDSIGSARGNSDSAKVREGVINQILTEIDGVEDLSDVIIIGATNRPELMDPALLRPGRFDRHLLVGPPTKKGIEEILQVHLKKDILPRGITYKKLSEKLNGYTGADIEAVVREAVISALRADKKATKIKEKHILDAIKKIKPSINKNALDAYEGALKEVEKGPDYLG
jgi:transitional endoplasmic reticulum ATPase